MKNTNNKAYKDFLNRLKVLMSKNQNLIKITLSNIFTMRMVGNKTHGDLAEIALSEFINQYMYDYKSEHIGKDKFRAKDYEEDIKVINELNNEEFFISIKAYGHGPLQLSTDKDARMFPFLKKNSITSISSILSNEVFENLRCLNVLPLIYDENKKQCNIMVFDFEKAFSNTKKIVLEDKGKGRKHPVFKFYDDEDNYICEVRYGGKDANALQRGFWTHTQHAENFFDSLTNGWIDYSDNKNLIKLFRYALISSKSGHDSAICDLQKDIQKLKPIR